MTQPIFIGFAGNPNCGKTTLFNKLTGSNGYVGNWPGVTVEKKQAVYKKDKNVTFVDLPGIYSLSPYSPEEVVSRDYLVNERPDVIVDLIDVTNIERSLYLSTQILEAGRPVVLGLNMMDLLKEHDATVDVARLSQTLGIPVVELSALKNKGTDELVKTAIEAASKGVAHPIHLFKDDLEQVLTSFEKEIKGLCAPELTRWFAIKIFERDSLAIQDLNLSTAQLARMEAEIEKLEVARDDDAEAIIISDRYDWIDGVVKACVTHTSHELTRSEKIDKIVTNRVLGLPIFIVAMVAVYWFAMVAVGTPATDFVNDGIFGDGFHLFNIGADAYDEAHTEFVDAAYTDQIDAYLATAQESGIETDEVASTIADEDYDPELIQSFEEVAGEKNIVATDVVKHDEDGNPVEEDGIIAEVTLADFKEALAQKEAEPKPEDYGIWVQGIPALVTSGLESIDASPFVVSLVVDGIIAGVGSVLGFIPQMLALFIALAFLEDCGYMSRVAFVMDRVFRRVGLSGKSFIPLLISSGCGVPGVMATKTIENEKDRRMTAMLTTMIPCSAKQPIIALFMGALAGRSYWWVAPMFYFMGIAAIVVSAIMLKKTKPFSGEPAPFVMELPDYHMPSLKAWALHVWERISSYIKKAGTVIFAAAVGIWLLSNFGFASWEGGSGAFGFLPAMNGPKTWMDYSLLAMLGNLIAWIFIPLGFGHWQATASSISALIAKENLVSTFAVLYGIGGATESSISMWAGFTQMFTSGGVVHVGAMCAFVAFNMLDAPCFAAIGTIRRQMDDKRWFWFAIAYQCIFGWVLGLIINQLWDFFVLGTFGIWTAVAFVLLAAIIFQTLRPTPKWEHKDERILETLTSVSQTQ